MYHGEHCYVVAPSWGRGSGAGVSEARAAGLGRDRGRGGQIVPRGGVIGDMLLTPSSHWHGGRVRVYRLGVNGCP